MSIIIKDTNDTLVGLKEKVKDIKAGNIIIYSGVNKIHHKNFLECKGIKLWGNPALEEQLQDKVFLDTLFNKDIANDNPKVEVVFSQIYIDGKKKGYPFMFINFKTFGAGDVGRINNFQNIILINCKNKEPLVVQKFHRKVRFLLEKSRFNGVLSSAISSDNKLLWLSTDFKEGFYPLIFENFGYGFLVDEKVNEQNTIVVGLKVSSDNYITDTLQGVWQLPKSRNYVDGIIEIAGKGHTVQGAYDNALKIFYNTGTKENYIRIMDVQEEYEKVRRDYGRYIYN